MKLLLLLIVRIIILISKKVVIHTVSRFSKNTLLNLKPGLESMDFSWTKNSVISRIF